MNSKAKVLPHAVYSVTVVCDSNQPHAVYSVTVVCDFKSVVVPAKCRHFDSDSYHRFCPVLHSSRFDPMAPGRYTGASPLLHVLLGRQQWQLRFSAVHEPCSEHYKVLVLGQPFHVLRAAESWDWTMEVHWRTPSGKRKWQGILQALFSMPCPAVWLNILMQLEANAARVER